MTESVSKIHTDIYTLTHIRTDAQGKWLRELHTYIHTLTRTYIRTYTYIYTHTHSHIRTYAQMPKANGWESFTHTYIYILYTHTQSLTHSHICTYIHTHRCPRQMAGKVSVLR
jgi:hypothetical protein